jgi:hypothetical protein
VSSFVKGNILLIQIQWDATPPLAKQCAISLSPPPSTQPQCTASLSPPPSTQPCHVASTQLHHAASMQPHCMAPNHPIRQNAQHGKPAAARKTAVNMFNDSHQEETCHLDLKRNMEHDDKMASIHLKNHKYELQYGSSPQTPSSAVVATQTTEDKHIEILHLQIRLAELN